MWSRLVIVATHVVTTHERLYLYIYFWWMVWRRPYVTERCLLWLRDNNRKIGRSGEPWCMFRWLRNVRIILVSLCVRSDRSQCPGKRLARVHLSLGPHFLSWLTHSASHSATALCTIRITDTQCITQCSRAVHYTHDRPTVHHTVQQRCALYAWPTHSAAVLGTIRITNTQCSSTGYYAHDQHTVHHALHHTVQQCWVLYAWPTHSASRSAPHSAAVLGTI